MLETVDSTGDEGFYIVMIITLLLFACLVDAKLTSVGEEKVGNCSVCLSLQLILPSIF